MTWGSLATPGTETCEAVVEGVASLNRSEANAAQSGKCEKNPCVAREGSTSECDDGIRPTHLREPDGPRISPDLRGCSRRNLFQSSDESPKQIHSSSSSQAYQTVGHE